MNPCQHCGAKTQLFLCDSCIESLRELLTGLVVGQELPSGHRAPGWIEYLQDCAWGRTRLGESARRSSDRTSPMPVHLAASELLDAVHATLGTWVRHICEARGIEVPANRAIAGVSREPLRRSSG